MDSIERLKKELGEDNPLVALVEAGPDQMERAANVLVKKIHVSKDKIDQRVVKEFSRLINDIVNERGDDLGIVQPFHIYEAVYPEVMEEIRNKTSLGVQYYHSMVKQLHHRFYFN